MTDANVNTPPEIIQAFIANPELDRSNVPSGTWHPFPTTREELQKSLAAIRLDGVVHSRFSVQTYNSVIDGLAETLPKEPDIDELNYLSARISEMDSDARSLLSAAVQTGEHKTLRDIINVTENLDCFYLEPALNARMLGEYQADMDSEDFAEHIEALIGSDRESDREFAAYIERLESCLDRYVYGKAKADEEHGHFTKAGYLTRANGGYVEVYNTPSDIPPEYRVFAYPGADMIRAAIQRKEGSQGHTACANGEIRPGDLVLSLPDDEYACLVGTVLEINRLGSAEHDTENTTDDVHVDFMAVEYSDRRIGEIEAMFSDLYDEPKQFGECPLDDVIMAPDSLLKITGISAEKLDAILDSEDKAAAFCKGATEKDRDQAGPDGKPGAGSPSLVAYLLENRQQTGARPPAPKRDSEPEL